MRWERLKISDFSQVITGGTPTTSKKEYWENGSIPWLNSGELNQNIIETCENKITELGLQNSSSRIMPPDTVLIALTGTTTGVVGYLTFEACANQSVTGILPSPKHHPKYLYYYLKSIRSKILEESYGGAQKHISQGYVKDLEIPLPPLETQKRIAEILDTADVLRQKDKELLKKYDELAQAIFIDMFGNPVKNEKEWIRYYGKELIEVLGGAAFSSKDYTSSGIPLIRIGTINKGYLDSTQLVYLPDSYFEKFKKYIIRPKDLLITLTGTAGKDDYGNVYEMEENLSYGLLNQRVAKLILDLKKINSRYLTYYLKQKDVKAELTGISRGVRQGNISNSDIYNLNIMLPPIELQNAFDKKVTSILNVKDNQLHNINKSDSLFSSILIKAFNGELVAK